MALVTTSLGLRNTFPYRSLGNREIRLVIVKAHTHWPRANSMSCSVRHINIDDSTSSIPYVALSYTLGDSQAVTSLKLVDETTNKSGEIIVTTSLVSALQAILEPGKHHAVWIDQICINQSSEVEKGEQVQLMRWIYERAKAVRVWLGPAYQESDKAMMYLAESDTKSFLRDLSDRRRLRFTVELEKAVMDLCLRPYWKRLWTAQEATALSPEDTIVSCGDSFISLQHLIFCCDATYEVYKAPNNFVTANVLHAHGLVAMRAFRRERSKIDPTLPGLVFGIRLLAASDPRDKIYSMLNFATDILDAEVKPDYTKTVRQTYTEIVLWLINKYHCLDVFGDCHPSLEDDAAPSWVPDWNRLSYPDANTKTSVIGLPTSNALYRTSSDYDVDVQQPVDVDTRLISLSGVRISKLSSVINHMEVKWNTWVAEKNWQPKDPATFCSLNELRMDEVFRRTIYSDMKCNIQGGFVYWSRGNHMPLPWSVTDFDITPEIAQMIASTREGNHGRCPFYTKSCAGSSQGLLGLSHDKARPGDELWILKGGKIPFILRPKPMTIPSTDLETGQATALPIYPGMPTYDLVGEAFVLGLMDGEIIDMLGETPRRRRPPLLAEMDRDWRTIGLI